MMSSVPAKVPLPLEDICPVIAVALLGTIVPALEMKYPNCLVA